MEKSSANIQLLEKTVAEYVQNIFHLYIDIFIIIRIYVQ